MCNYSHQYAEQKHVETSCKVSFAGVSVVLFFQDENNWKDVSMGIHYLGAELRDISVSFQVTTLMNCVPFPH